jgi:sugar phosphate isomerase/epimerase
MTRTFDLGQSFGIMQGRLSTQTERGYQAFPWETWQEEFCLAADRGIEHIEWVLDTWRLEENPILSETNDLIQCIQEAGVKVVSVCADYLMDRPLEVSDPDSWTVLGRLTGAMQEIGAKWLVIPCVDHSSLRTVPAQTRFVKAADQLCRKLVGTDIRVSVEADLGPAEFAALLSELDSDFFGVNYDIGNSAYLGYSHMEEFNAYGNRISLVHIKDRILGGGSVPLGNGNADIAGVIDHLREIKFNGPVTMQAFRDVQGINVLDEQLSWLAAKLEASA